MKQARPVSPRVSKGRVNKGRVNKGRARYFGGSAVIVALASLAAVVVRSSTDEPPPPPPSADELLPADLRGLPEAAFAALVIPDLRRYVAHTAATPFGQLLDDPALRASSLGSASAPLDGDLLPRMRSAFALLMTFRDFDLRSISLAAYPLASGRVGFGARLACDDPEKVAGWLDQHLSIHADRTESGARGGVAWVCHSDVCRAVVSGGVVVSTPMEALGPMLDGNAGEPPDVARRLSTERTPEVELQAMMDVATLRQLAPGDLPLANIVEAIDRLSWSESIDGASYRATVSLECQPSSVLDMVLRPAASEPPNFDFVLPAAASRATFGIMTDWAATFDAGLEFADATRSEAAASELRNGLALSRQLLGFDVRDDLLAALGDNFGWAVWDGAGGDGETPSAPDWIIVADVRDRTSVQSLLGKFKGFLDLVGVRAKKRRRDGATIVELRLGGDVAAIALTDQLAISNRLDLVLATIDGTLPALTTDEAYLETQSTFAPGASWWHYTRRGERVSPLIRQAHALEQRARQAESQVFEQVNAIGSAIEQFREHQGATPVSENAFDLVAQLAPIESEQLPATDMWGQPFHYAFDDLGRYVVWSDGADGTAERDWSSCLSGCPELMLLVRADRDDIVLANGEFVRWPAEQALASEHQLPDEVEALAAMLDQHIAELPPTLGALRPVDGGYIYELVSPLPTGLSLGRTSAVTVALMRDVAGEARMRDGQR